MASRLVWRSPLPAAGRGWAPWVYTLKGQNGAYAIRDVRSHDVLYVGESHSHRLFETMTRHLHNWSGFGSGPSYSGLIGSIEVAALILSRDEAIVEQYELIARLQPRDNVRTGHSLFRFRDATDDDDVSDIPF
jgi:hypothetical protein